MNVSLLLEQVTVKKKKKKHLQGSPKVLKAPRNIIMYSSPIILNWYFYVIYVLNKYLENHKITLSRQCGYF